MTVESHRLPKYIFPIHYDLFFDVDLKNFKFRGKEEINLEVKRSTKHIVLNCKNLKILGARLIQRNKSILAKKIKTDNKKNRLTLEFREVTDKPARLVVEFEGELKDNLSGFYRSKYIENNKTKYLATTQFEAPYARQAFPCFDEPDLKATFDVYMKIAKNLKAVSNMPIKKEIVQGNKRIIEFHRTPKMSTYLLYLGVGDFEFLEEKLNKTLIRIVTTPGKKQQTKFALELTKKFLNYFEKYSGIRYPLPKLDMIALADFAAGAMENWGAITFREIYLLFDPKTTSTLIKKRIAMIIAHEIWHQWSGNLVTMKWWNDLWLNESFATFMAYKAVDHCFPQWRMWEEFVDDEVARAFEDDSLKTTHPIEVSVKDPHQIEEIFDAISYSKGGSVLWMLESYLGEDVFRKGVRKYLLNNQYSNATSEDLWNTLDKISHKTIEKMMKSWIRQPGYPIVDANASGSSIFLKQRKFVFNQTDNKTKWMIPLVAKSGNKTFSELLDEKQKRIKLNFHPKWIKLNLNQNGFYRVRYSDENLRQLMPIINQFSALDRWGLQNDLFRQAVNGELSIAEYLDFLSSFQHEKDYLVLTDIHTNMYKIYAVFNEQDFWPDVWNKLKVRYQYPFKKILSRLSWNPKPNENQHDSMLRALTIRYLAFTEDSDTIKLVLAKYKKYLKKKDSLHPDLRSTILSTVARNTDEKTFKTFVNLYLKTKDPEEKVVLLQSLGQFRNPKILKKTLNFSISDKVRVQDLFIIFGSVANNPCSRSVIVQWMKSHWKKIESYEENGKIFLRLLESFISTQLGRDTEKELRDFFRKHPIKYKFTLEKSFERLKRNNVFLEKNRESLKNYFS